MKQCTIEIIDEVNCKLTGLDLQAKKFLVNKFKYEIPGARYQPAVRLGRWDGKIAFFQQSGSTYINLLPDIIPYLYDQGYELDVLDQRVSLNKFEFDKIHENSFAHINWPPGHPAAGTPILIRDYQVEIINRFLNNTQCLSEIATGSGKTIMTAALSASVEKYGRSIVIVPNKTLVTQTESDYINVGLNVGVFFGDRKEFDRTHTICTWQSLNNLLKLTQTGDTNFTINDFIDGVVCVIVDEAHAATATALKTLLTTVFSNIPIRWGLTGTIPKEEYQAVSIKCSIGETIGKLAASELQEAGHLANCHVNILQLMDHAEYSNYQSELKYLTSNPERIAYIAKIIDRIKDTGNTLILVDRIETGKMLQIELSNLHSLLGDKPEVAFVSGVTKSKNRKAEYDEVATANNKILIATYGVAAVGINIPRIFNLVLFEPGKSFTRVIQSIGRGLRKAEDKVAVDIYDITSSCKFSKRHLTKRKTFYNEANYKFSIEKISWK